MEEGESGDELETVEDEEYEDSGGDNIGKFETDEEIEDLKLNPKRDLKFPENSEKSEIDLEETENIIDETVSVTDTNVNKTGEDESPNKAKYNEDDNSGLGADEDTKERSSGENGKDSEIVIITNQEFGKSQNEPEDIKEKNSELGRRKNDISETNESNSADNESQNKF